MDPRTSEPEPPRAVDDSVSDPHDDAEQTRIDLEYLRTNTPLFGRRLGDLRVYEVPLVLLGMAGLILVSILLIPVLGVVLAGVVSLNPPTLIPTCIAVFAGCVIWCLRRRREQSPTRARN